MIAKVGGRYNGTSIKEGLPKRWSCFIYTGKSGDLFLVSFSIYNYGHIKIIATFHKESKYKHLEKTFLITQFIVSQQKRRGRYLSLTV